MLILDTETEEKSKKTKTEGTTEKISDNSDDSDDEAEAEVDVSALKYIKPNHKATINLLNEIQTNQTIIYKKLDEISKNRAQPKFKLVDKSDAVNVGTTQKTFQERLTDLLVNYKH